MINSDTFGMTFWLDNNNEFCIVLHLMITNQTKIIGVMLVNGWI